MLNCYHIYHGSHIAATGHSRHCIPLPAALLVRKQWLLDQVLESMEMLAAHRCRQPWWQMGLMCHVDRLGRCTA